MNLMARLIDRDRNRRSGLLWCSAITLLAGCVAAPSQKSSVETAATTLPPRPQAAPATADRRLELSRAVARLGAGFDGSVGISVRDVRDGWTANFGPAQLRPQQSVSKLWVALTVLDGVDGGRLSLQDPVLILPSDLTLFHQPIRDLVGPAGYRITIGELLRQALTRSDNTANDALLRAAGGPAAVRRCLAAKGLVGIGFGPGERLLQSNTAGLAWKQEYSIGDAFFTARAALPAAVRSAALVRYLADPPDGASADGITAALAGLAAGRLLSPSSTSLLLTLMSESLTGQQRVRGGLSAGWSFAHKTGTGQELDGLATGYNDVGIMTSPAGHRYAVAVMISSTRLGISARQALMSDVARAVIAVGD